jgi:hypothetical protein
VGRATAEHGRPGDDGDQHAWYGDIGAVLGGAGDVGGAVDEGQGTADAAQLGARAEDHGVGLGDRELGGVGRELAEVEAAIAGLMDDAVIGGAAGGGVDLPAAGGGGDQHHSRGRAGAAHILVDAAHAVGAVGVLIAVLGVAVGLDDADAGHVGAELVGDEHGQRAADALAHLGALTGDRDEAVEARRGRRRWG